ncbi:unnamed protein product [Protopolystoma xenopodis]|uniref:Uncharacterized protein n=1 Tax=Protopolystoma xenopodis TaxID=117903 RepID=A0A3S5A7D1_9PLAT|nr:unnamed protein product [Protopolystoma xenopodis]
MELVNIIGDGTTAHMLALLTGLFETELPESRRFPDNRFRPVEEASQGVLKGEIANETTVDTFPWVWDRYSRLAGYATHYIEDEPHWGSFQYRLRGFGAAREPVTSYGRPCLVQAISDVKKYPRTLGCIYSRCFYFHLYLVRLFALFRGLLLLFFSYLFPFTHP